MPKLSSIYFTINFIIMYYLKQFCAVTICDSDCPQTNICLLLNAPNQTMYNDSFKQNTIISHGLVDEPNKHAIFCTSFTNLDFELNTPCWSFTQLPKEKNYDFLFYHLATYVPAIQHESVDIADLLDGDYSPCYQGIKVPCNNKTSTLYSGKVILHTRLNESILFGSNFYFDGSYQSSYFNVENSIMCILDEIVYSSIKCLEKVNFKQMLNTPINNSTSSSYSSSKVKPFPPRELNRSLKCLPLKFIYEAPHFSPTRIKLYLVSHSISLCFLIVHIYVTIFWEKGTQYPRNIFLFFAISLGLEMVGIMIQVIIQASIEICFIIYFIQRFGALASFFWISIIGFDLWRKFRLSDSCRESLNRKGKIIRILKYACFGWLLPLLIVGTDIVTAIVTSETSVFHYEYIYPSCLIWKEVPSNVFYRIPMILILAVNFYFFLMSIRAIYKTKKIVAQQIKESSDNKFNYFSIFWKFAALMGLQWVISILAWVLDIEVLHYVDIVLVSMQSVFLFLLFTLKHIIKKLKNETTCFRSQNKSDYLECSLKEKQHTVETTLH